MKIWELTVSNGQVLDSYLCYCDDEPDGILTEDVDLWDSLIRDLYDQYGDEDESYEDFEADIELSFRELHSDKGLTHEILIDERTNKCQAFIVHIQYQGDDRVEDQYTVYMRNATEDDVEEAVLNLDYYDSLESDCICNWADEDDDEDEQYATMLVEEETDPDIINSDWFKSLEILIDER